eukprot:g13580.t1
MSAARLDFTPSICDVLATGSLLSSRSSACLGAGLLALGIASLDFSPPLRSYTCPGVALPVFDAACLDFSPLLQGNLQSGAPLSANSHIAVALPVCEISSIGLTPLVHSFVCLGFSPLVLGSCRSAPILSAVDAVHLGLSSFSQGRAQAEKASLTVGFSNLGPLPFLQSLARSGQLRVSVCGLAKFTSTVSVQEVIRLGKETTYIKTDWQVGYDGGFGYVFDTVEVWAGTSNDPTPKRGIGTWGNGGHLHGTWTADNAVSTSDRRLKKSIIPLYEAMKGQGQSEEAEGVSWVLRQLRPVSFKFKNGPEAKYSRYGFIAQELQEVLPSVVRSVQTDGREHLAVAYQDGG